jgi:hypothetical protein
MKENVILMVVPAAAVVIALLLKNRISDALRRRGNPPEKIEAKIRARLIQTDWAFYEHHLRRPIPAALRELYSDMALLSACASYRWKREEINSFEPLNESCLLDTHDEIGYDVVPFATSVCGDAIYLRPGARESDTVYIAYHDDPGNIEVFAESVSEMLEKARGVKTRAS